MQNTKQSKSRPRNGKIPQRPGTITHRGKQQPARNEKHHRSPIALQEVDTTTFLVPKNRFTFIQSDGYSSEHLMLTLYKILVRAYTVLGKVHILNDKTWDKNVTKVEIMNWLIDRCYEIKHHDTFLFYNGDRGELLEYAEIPGVTDADHTVDLSFIDKIKNKYEIDVMHDAISLMVHECQISLWNDGIFDMTLDSLIDRVNHNDQDGLDKEEFDEIKKEIEHYNDYVADKLKFFQRHRTTVGKFKEKVKDYGKFLPIFEQFFGQLCHCVETECKVYNHVPIPPMEDDLETQDESLIPWETMKFIWVHGENVVTDYNMYMNDTANNYWVKPWVTINTWKETHYEPFKQSDAIRKLQILMSLLTKIQEYYEQLPRKNKPGLLVDILSGQEGETSIL